jgi:hypothetical protein
MKVSIKLSHRRSLMEEHLPVAAGFFPERTAERGEFGSVGIEAVGFESSLHEGIGQLDDREILQVMAGLAGKDFKTVCLSYTIPELPYSTESSASKRSSLSREVRTSEASRLASS